MVLLDNKLSTRVLILILATAMVAVAVSSIRISEMGIGDFWVETVLPLPYWIGISIIALVGFFSIRFLSDQRYQNFMLLLSITLLICFRVAFPVMFTSVVAYEADVINYMKIISSWSSTGIDFSTAGHYEHDYPLAYLIGFTFIKLGTPIDLFFRIAPFVIYILDAILLYFIVREVTSENKKIACVSVYLFSFSSLGYWLAVHYCPDNLGSIFYFISLYACIRFAKAGVWSPKAITPVLLSIFALILAHHLSTLYFILTLFGLALSTWYFNPPQIKGKALSFLLLGVFAYTFWFAYGTFMYPSFFNVYSYFGGGYGSTTGLIQQAGWFNNFSFIIYPLFIASLFIIELTRVLEVKGIKDILKIRQKLSIARVKESSNFTLVFSLGFIFILFLLFAGFGLSVSFPTRVLEVLCIGLYPFASPTFLRLSDGNISKKRLIIFLAIFLFVVLSGEHRYYSQIQRRVIVG
jgi:hypothetical protein